MLDRAGSAIVEVDRRSHILAAAERAFVRHGFHAASMQAIAAEAKMSAGNLYRYFASKEALVFGLVAQDQAMIAREFETISCAEDVLTALGGILRHHLVEAPVERYGLIVEIWAEMTRNPSLAAHCGGIDRTLKLRLQAVVERAQRTGSAAGHVDAGFVVRILATMVAGLFKRRATDPTFDGEAELALALGVVRAALDGTVTPYVLAEREMVS